MLSIVVEAADTEGWSGGLMVSGSGIVTRASRSSAIVECRGLSVEIMSEAVVQVISVSNFSEITESDSLVAVDVVSDEIAQEISGIA